jgi:hypothetical protein
MTSKEKNKTKIVWVDGTPVTPITAVEHKKIERSINKKHAKLRRKYKELHGRTISCNDSLTINQPPHKFSDQLPDYVGLPNSPGQRFN